MHKNAPVVLAHNAQNAPIMLAHNAQNAPVALAHIAQNAPIMLAHYAPCTHHTTHNSQAMHPSHVKING